MTPKVVDARRRRFGPLVGGRRFLVSPDRSKRPAVFRLLSGILDFSRFRIGRDAI